MPSMLQPDVQIQVPGMPAPHVQLGVLPATQGEQRLHRQAQSLGVCAVERVHRLQHGIRLPPLGGSQPSGRQRSQAQVCTAADVASPSDHSYMIFFGMMGSVDT